MSGIYDREPMVLFNDGMPQILPLMHQQYNIKPISSRKFLDDIVPRIEGMLAEQEYIRTKDVIIFREFDEEQVAHYFAMTIELHIQVSELEDDEDEM